MTNEILDEVWSKVTEKWIEICKFNPELEILDTEIAYYNNDLNPKRIYVHLRLKEPYGHSVIFKHYYESFIQLDPQNPKFYGPWDFWE